MFYKDQLLQNNDCYILKIGSEIAGRAPINEDFVIKSNYTWKDTDFRNIVEMTMDFARQSFKNVRQLFGHAQTALGTATKNNEMVNAGNRNIRIGKSPTDTSYKTEPQLERAQSTYALPTLTFVFINTDDETTHLKEAEKFLWMITAIEYQNIKESDLKEDDWEDIKGKPGFQQAVIGQKYSSQTPGHWPGYGYQTSSNATWQRAGGFTIEKGNLKISNLSLENFEVSLSKETNLEGYPQAVKVSLNFKDTQRRWPQETIETVRAAMQSGSLVRTTTLKREVKKPKKENEATQSSSNNPSQADVVTAQVSG